MQRGHRLQFSCESCGEDVFFSVLEQKHFTGVCCGSCKRKYLFDDATLVRQLKQFEALCRQIHNSAEILGKAAIAIDINGERVTLPFNLLLTRLNSLIELQMNGKKIAIIFRVEPLIDFPEASKEACCSLDESSIS